MKPKIPLILHLGQDSKIKYRAQMRER